MTPQQVSGPVPPALAARITVTALLALVLLLVLWETTLAPLRPGSGWWALKAVPLVLVLPGVMRGGRRARQWLALLLPFYVAEGCARAYTGHGRHALVAGVAAALALAAFAGVLAWFRSERPTHR